jgi:hypothetical protein
MTKLINISLAVISHEILLRDTLSIYRYNFQKHSVAAHTYHKFVKMNFSFKCKLNNLFFCLSLFLIVLQVQVHCDEKEEDDLCLVDYLIESQSKTGASDSERNCSSTDSSTVSPRLDITTNTSPPVESPTTSKNCRCVKYYECDAGPNADQHSSKTSDGQKNSSSTSGEDGGSNILGIVDVRSGGINPCPHYFEVCCDVRQILSASNF